jgi:hypothetical protein
VTPVSRSNELTLLTHTSATGKLPIQDLAPGRTPAVDRGRFKVERYLVSTRRESLRQRQEVCSVPLPLRHTAQDSPRFIIDRGILKGSAKPSILLASASIILHKADTLPVFPAYSPILAPPIPSKLPWAVPGELTVGESRESNLTIRRGFGGGEGSEGGEVSMRVVRKGSAFGPGDVVPIFVELEWSGNVPIRVRLSSRNFSSVSSDHD